MTTKRKAYSFIVNTIKHATSPFVKIEISGLEHIPKDSGAIVILNHISLLDPMLVGVALSKTRQVRALAKDSLFKAPILGQAMKSMGHIPVERGTAKAKDSLRAAVEKLQAGELVGLYPEGTVPETIGELGPFKSGAARLALESGAVVIPLVGWGAQAVLPRNEGKLKSLWRAFFRKPIHRMVVGEPLGPFYGDADNFDEVKALTQEFRKAISELLPQVRQGRVRVERKLPFTKRLKKKNKTS